MSRRLLALALLAPLGCDSGGGDPPQELADVPTSVDLDATVGARPDVAEPVDHGAVGDTAPESRDGGSPPADAGPQCEPTGFVSAGVRWSLPDGLEGPAYSLGGAGPPGDCDPMTFGLASLRGGALDLVVTRDCEPGSGHRLWRVYGNTGDGFSDGGARWTLPEGFDADDFAGFAGGDPEDCERPSYGLLDLDGSGASDLVVSFDCERGSGESHWRVYRNTGSGFSNAGVRWPLPPGFGPEAFKTFAGFSEDCGSPSYGLLDLTGDGRVDLVVTKDCEMGTGQSHWWVYPNLGNGFAQAPRRWSVPRIMDDQDHLRFADAHPREVCDPPTYALNDLDGDARPDLVVTHDCERGSGQTHWRVYPNTGEGFADASRRWSLPAGFGPDTFYAFANIERREDCDPISYALLDLTRDGRADLVVTHDCADMGSGTTTWRVYENEGNGFADAGRLWDLPAGFDADTFYALAGATADDCAPPSFSVLDLEADGRLEIVVTRDCERGSGESFWRLYRSACP